MISCPFYTSVLLWRIFWLGGPFRVLKLVEKPAFPGLFVLVIWGIFGVTALTVEENWPSLPFSWPRLMVGSYSPMPELFEFAFWFYYLLSVELDFSDLCCAEDVALLKSV
jgi:hypothetical protein